jgi:hypothetical protein
LAVYSAVPRLEGGAGVLCAGGGELGCPDVDGGVVDGCVELLGRLDPVVDPWPLDVVLGGAVVALGALELS